jgi:hypothetical protein
MFNSLVSTSVNRTDLPSTVTVGATFASFWRAQARSLASVVSTPGVSPGNVLHSNVLAATKEFRAGFYRARLDAVRCKRRNRAAEVPARE